MGTITTIPSSSVPVAASATAKRILALDALRGLAITGMILVVSPGSWGHRLPMLDHAPWHGYTLADLVFPAFLFAVGAAMALGFPSDRPTGQYAARVGRRTLSLIGLGLLLNLLPGFDFANLRIPGVLQRIGLCYALAATIMLSTAKLVNGTRHLNINALFLALQVQAGRKLLQPVLILGSNAILAFVLSQVLLAYSGTPIGGSSPQSFGFEVAMAIVSHPVSASLLCALGVLAVVMLLVWPLDRKGIFIRL